MRRHTKWKRTLKGGMMDCFAGSFCILPGRKTSLSVMQFMQFKPSSLHREIVAKLIQTTQLKGGKSCAIHCNNTKSDADVFVLFL